MILDRYDFTTDSITTVFQFTSMGRTVVVKVVMYSETATPNIYNLGLGDWNSETGELDDQIVTDNRDRNKVLATVAATLPAFFEKYPQAEAIAVGNTESRKWLYRKSVERYLPDIERGYIVKGYFQKRWIPFSKDIPFEAILITRKKVNL